MVMKGRTQSELDAIESERRVGDEIRSLEAHLSTTDWYVVRKSETGIEVPAEVTASRESARARISELRNRL